jgi:SAM-dependent methyltransferase
MSALTAWIDRTFYPRLGANWDTQQLRDRIDARLTPDMEILDLGSGRGHLELLRFHGRCKFVAGVDPDPIVLSNTNLDEAKVQEPPRYAIPYPDNRFDLVFCSSVIEHVSDPTFFFSEAFRVLRPGGLFLAKTPNRRHYVATIARATPHRFHDFYNRLRGRSSHDTFPTVYACNTPGELRSVASAVGFKVLAINVVEGRPEYLRLTAPTYLAGLAYERMVNSAELFRGIRCVLFVELQKPVTLKSAARPSPQS